VGLHVTRQARRFGGALRLSETPASRRSTVAILGRAPRLPHRTCVRIGYSELLAPGVVVPGGGGAGPPGASGCESPPRDATPRSAFRCGSRTRP